MRIFHYPWESFLWDDVLKKSLNSPKCILNGADCFGIYYVTGSHFIYGQDTMLYLGKVIDLTEKLLINAIVSALNSMSIKGILDNDTYGDILICNWGDIGFMLPDISGYRFSNKYWEQQKYPERLLTE